MTPFRKTLTMAATAIVLAASLSVSVDARQRGSFGSRGGNTYSAPPSTSTAPNSARPLERSVTQPGQAARPSAAAPANAARPGGFFNRPGLLGGLAAGFLGAGLFGMLFGQGMFGNLGGLASFMGFLLQAGLIVMVGWFLWSMWKRRSQPQSAYASSGSMMRQSTEPQHSSMGLGGLGSALGGLGGNRAAAQPEPVAAGNDQVGIGPQDYETFERLLADIQIGYGKGDIAGLRTRMTPEMLSYYSEEMSALASRGLENSISDVKLLQGDLAEAWREGNMEYATVAMRYSLVDKTVDRATGRVVEGSDAPDEATEIWTFVRSSGGHWLASAVQQTN